MPSHNHELFSKKERKHYSTALVYRTSVPVLRCGQRATIKRTFWREGEGRPQCFWVVRVIPSLVGEMHIYFDSPSDIRERDREISRATFSMVSPVTFLFFGLCFYMNLCLNTQLKEKEYHKIVPRRSNITAAIQTSALHGYSGAKFYLRRQEKAHFHCVWWGKAPQY